jgi:hypothetical protein
MTITLKARSLNLALQDYCDTCYVEGYKTVADKHWLTATEFKLYIVKHAGAIFFDKWERYNRDHHKAVGSKYNSANVLTYIRPSWYTGAPKCKYIPRHHILWCLYHDVTEVPKGYVVYHPHSQYNDGHPSEFVCLTRSEHQQLVNTKRRETANGLPTV